MEKRDAVAALSALAQDNRLDVFRLLVQAGPDGLSAGRVAEELHIASNTLTFHFDRLRAAGLVTVRREGRSMIYAARYEAMNALLAYLTEHCCRGRANHSARGNANVGGAAREGDGGMRLYMFEHCSLCFRVRMIAGLKRLHLQETIVLDDDSDTMIRLVGKRVIPILVKDDSKVMLESMDMVKYMDQIGEPVLTGPERNEVGAWANRVVEKTAPLTMPRYPLLGLAEFETVAALDHYTLRKREAFGDLVELRAKTRHYINRLMPDLEELDRLIESPLAVNGTPSVDDIRVLPLLRSAAIVRGLRFPLKVRNYFESMMDRVGYQPLPTI